MADSDVPKVTDLRVLTALAHPLRRRLLDVLTLDGPATASTLAERTDQAVANISHHLRVLAACDLIVEAPELARDRRERWWRPVSSAVRWSTADFTGDPASAAVATAAESLNLEYHMSAVRAWYANRETERETWPEGPFAVNKWVRLTPQELTELSEQIIALLDRWATRDLPEDGQRREPVYVFAHGVPARP